MFSEESPVHCFAIQIAASEVLPNSTASAKDLKTKRTKNHLFAERTKKKPLDSLFLFISAMISSIQFRQN
jgi:hypothetical protein